MTLSIIVITLRRMRLRSMVLGRTALSIMTHNLIPCNIMSLSIMRGPFRPLGMTTLA